MPSDLVDQRLNIHLFAPLTGDNHDRAYGQLRQVWQSCVVGMDISCPFPSTPGDPPTCPDQYPATGLVAGRQAHGTALREMWWDHDHDIACLSLTLSEHPSAGWSDLHTQWSTAVEDVSLDAIIGIALVFTALEPTGTPACDTDLSTTITQTLPGKLAPGWDNTIVTVRECLQMWQVSPDSDDPLRHLVIVAPATGDDELGQFVWSAGLAPLTRYLLNAAKLRYQQRVLHHDTGGLYQQRHHVTATLQRLRPLLLDSSATDANQLHDAQQQLAILQADETGLIDSLVSVKTMRRTVEIHAANMAALAEYATGQRPSGSKGHLFDRDHKAALDLCQILDDEAVYLEAASQRAQHFVAVADRELTRRAQLESEHNRQRQERFTLIQTAIIGAAIIALTAIQAFGYQIPLPGPTKPAVIATLGATALWLSAIALRLSGQHSPRPSSRVPSRRKVFEVGSFGILTASLTWTLTSLAPTHHGWITIIAAAIGFAVGLIGSGWAHRKATR